MKEFVADVPGERDQSQRNALLFLMFPATFEDITSDDHKRRIAEAHADVAGEDPDLDRRLRAVRSQRNLVRGSAGTAGTCDPPGTRRRPPSCKALPVRGSCA